MVVRVKSSKRTALLWSCYIAEFERDLIRERTSAGRVSAKKRGVRFGRPEKMNESQKSLASRLLQEGKSASEVAKTFNVHKATICRLPDYAEWTAYQWRNYVMEEDFWSDRFSIENRWKSIENGKISS